MESAPKDGQGILTYPHYVVTSWVTSEDNNGVEGWISDYDEDAQQYIVMKNEPKYWCPLPKPPKYRHSEDKNKDSND